MYEKYDDQKLGFITANELHVPASDDGVPRPVYLTLKSADVCHSFWVPRLGGKTDLIPGRTNQMWFQTNQQGVFLGQCAEYCGTQHANMLLRVNVDSPAEFQSWLENQQRPAVDNPRGCAGARREFLSQSCVNCHRVTGTTARGTYAPDLTHLMSRQTIAAGMTPNTRDELRKWLNDPQQTKEGCLMPRFGLNARRRRSSRGLLDDSQIELLDRPEESRLIAATFQACSTRDNGPDDDRSPGNRTVAPAVDRRAPRMGDHRRSQEDRRDVHPRGDRVPARSAAPKRS